jgi:hypothetical protein
MAATATTLKAEQRRAPPLAVVSEGYLVGRRRPLSELAPEQQEQIRKAYFDTAWASDYCLDLLGFYTDLGTAEEKAAQYESGFVLSLPVNAVRPDGLGRYGVQSHPNSPAQDDYLGTSPKMEKADRYDRDQLERLHSEVKQHVEELQKIAL